MVTATPVSLGDDKARKLKLWLAQAESEDLRRVIRSLAQQHACKAIADALEIGAYPAKIDAASEELTRAQKYKHALEVLDEITNSKEPLFTVKLS
jgi:hypothetical protein